MATAKGWRGIVTLLAGVTESVTGISAFRVLRAVSAVRRWTITPNGPVWSERRLRQLMIADTPHPPAAGGDGPPAAEAAPVALSSLLVADPVLTPEEPAVLSPGKEKAILYRRKTQKSGREQFVVAKRQMKNEVLYECQNGRYTPVKGKVTNDLPSRNDMGCR